MQNAHFALHACNRVLAESCLEETALSLANVAALKGLADTISVMDDFRSMAQDPKHRRSFEKLLYLAAQHGDADLVAERLSWGIDPNCVFSKGRTPLIANPPGSCPSAATVRALLEAGADPSMTDESGLTALNYARRKLARLQAR